MSDTICEWCGVLVSEHSRDILATECYPEQVKILRAENARLLAALRAIDCSAQCDWCADIARAAIARAEGK